MQRHKQNFETPQQRTDSINLMNLHCGGPVDVTEDGLSTPWGAQLEGSWMIYVQAVEGKYAVITAIGEHCGYAWVESYENV